MKRPAAVTFFGWFWTVGGLLGMVASWPLAQDGADWVGSFSPGPFWQMPSTFVFLYSFFASLIGLLFGNGLLRGRNWSRFLAVGYGLAGALISFMWWETTPLFWLNLFGNLAFTGVMWFFLFRPEAEAYFNNAAGPGSPETAI